MPKAAGRSGARKHLSSARPRVRFADSNPEDNPSGGMLDDGSIDPTASGSEILAAITRSAEAKVDVNTVKKKDKMKAKHDAFVQRLESAPSPFARSKDRAGKQRKLKPTLSFGMEDMNSALESIFADDDGEEWGGLNTQPKQGKKQKTQLIGESTTKMTSAQMKRILREEQKRLPLIQQHPAFAANPFATIRLHAENTLVKHGRAKKDAIPSLEDVTV